MDVLDVGPGQFLVHMIYFAQHNHVIGIDLDVIAQGWGPIVYCQMLRRNGLRRTLKSLLRRVSGIDRLYFAEIKRQLALASIPRMRVHCMDACRISFQDQSFDLVHSRSVLHHLPDPEAAVKHVVRILRPGGFAFFSLHLFTSSTGCLDPRVFIGRSELAAWAHLRPRSALHVAPNAYVNKLRLQEWRRLFAENMPGAQITCNRSSDPGLDDLAIALKADGELAEFSLEELLTCELVVLWRRPAACETSQVISAAPQIPIEAKD